MWPSFEVAPWSTEDLLVLLLLHLRLRQPIAHGEGVQGKLTRLQYALRCALEPKYDNIIIRDFERRAGSGEACVHACVRGGAKRR